MLARPAARARRSRPDELLAVLGAHVIGERRITRQALILLAQVGLLTLFLTMMVGIFAAVQGHRWGAFAGLGAISVEFLVYLVAAVVIYRRTMRRPWPKVTPVEDDDDW